MLLPVMVDADMERVVMERQRPVEGCRACYCWRHFRRPGEGVFVSCLGCPVWARALRILGGTGR